MNLSSVKNLEDILQHKAVLLKHDSFFHSIAINQLNNFEIKAFPPIYLRIEQIEPLHQAVVLGFIHTLAIDSLQVPFDTISMTALDILNYAKVPKLDECTETYKFFYDLVDAENKKLGIDELCVTEKAYKLHIQNECCRILVYNYGEIEPLNQHKAIFDIIRKENSLK